jgi:hypothetical protein
VFPTVTVFTGSYFIQISPGRQLFTTAGETMNFFTTADGKFGQLPGGMLVSFQFPPNTFANTDFVLPDFSKATSTLMSFETNRAVLGTLDPSSVNTVPEPSTLFLVGAGVTGMVLAKRRKRHIEP